jgi:twitching motility protein PilI
LEPFELLQNIARRSKLYAADLPAQSESDEFWRGVGFMLAGKRFVAPMDHVSEILTVPRHTLIPGVKYWVGGVANLRGRLLPLIELAGFFGESSQGTTRSKRVLVVSSGDRLDGLIVDGVLGMQSFPSQFYQSGSGIVPDSLAPYVDGCYETEGDRWPVFNLHKLVESHEFSDIAV